MQLWTLEMKYLHEWNQLRKSHVSNNNHYFIWVSVVVKSYFIMKKYTAIRHCIKMYACFLHKYNNLHSKNGSQLPLYLPPAKIWILLDLNKTFPQTLCQYSLLFCLKLWMNLNGFCHTTNQPYIFLFKKYKTKVPWELPWDQAWRLFQRPHDREWKEL